MSDVASDFLKAVRAALIADATANGLLAGRVYSDWSSGDTFPLARMSIPVLADWEDDCGHGTEADVRVHCFAQSVTGRHALANAVRNALDEAALALDSNALLWLDYVQTINASDPDDPTVHMAVVRFTAVAAVSP